MRMLNPRRLVDGRIDAKIEHPELGWIPYTASPDGDPEIWRELQARADIAPYDPASDPIIAEKRASASTTRTAFCLALKRAGILSPADAITAAKGDWPDSFTAALDALPGGIDRDEAQIVWAAVSEIVRTDPVLLALQSYLSLTDEQVDGLFGL